MFVFEDIINRMLVTMKLKNKSELAKIMNVSTATMGNWKARNKIPFEEIITLCLKNNIDIKFILTGNENSTSNHIQKIENQNGLNIQGNNNQVSNIKTDSKKLEIIEKIEKLPPKRQDYYYHVISAELLNLED